MIIGIDPGSVSAAYAVLNEAGECVDVDDVPVVDRMVDGSEFSRIVGRIKPREAIIEQVSASYGRASRHHSASGWRRNIAWRPARSSDPAVPGDCGKMGALSLDPTRKSRAWRQVGLAARNWHARTTDAPSAAWRAIWRHGRERR
jgi:hypothetical protein